MRDIFWGGVQPIMVRGGVQPTTTTTITITRSRWHGGVGELNFQPYCKGRSGTGEKETHYINVVGINSLDFEAKSHDSQADTSFEYVFIHVYI